MGGHKAWRKRVAAGEPAKGQAGAIARHRPRLGRKGKDIELNRKGNIAGGNPKKKPKTKVKQFADTDVKSQPQEWLRSDSTVDEGYDKDLMAKKRRVPKIISTMLLLGLIMSLGMTFVWFSLGNSKIKETNISR